MNVFGFEFKPWSSNYPERYEYCVDKISISIYYFARQNNNNYYIAQLKGYDRIFSSSEQDKTPEESLINLYKVALMHEYLYLSVGFRYTEIGKKIKELHDIKDILE